jgi:hypothetical protein
MERTTWESIKGDAQSLLAKLRELLHEGNIRRIVVKHHDRVVAEFPLTAGVVGTVVAPALAAVGAIVALLKDCTVEIEKDERGAGNGGRNAAAG